MRGEAEMLAARLALQLGELISAHEEEMVGAELADVVEVARGVWEEACEELDMRTVRGAGE